MLYRFYSFILLKPSTFIFLKGVKSLTNLKGALPYALHYRKEKQLIVRKSNMRTEIPIFSDSFRIVLTISSFIQTVPILFPRTEQVVF